MWCCVFVSFSLQHFFYLFYLFVIVILLLLRVPVFMWHSSILLDVGVWPPCHIVISLIITFFNYLLSNVFFKINYYYYHCMWSATGIESDCDFLCYHASHLPFPVFGAVNRRPQCPTWILRLYNVWKPERNTHVQCSARTLKDVTNIRLHRRTRSEDTTRGISMF